MRITRKILSNFLHRHIGNYNSKEMLKTVNCKSIDELVKESLNINSNFKLKNNIVKKDTFILNELNTLMNKNKKHKSYIGMGYSSSILPSNKEEFANGNPVKLLIIF